jgi:hypothetical protein
MGGVVIEALSYPGVVDFVLKALDAVSEVARVDSE